MDALSAVERAISLNPYDAVLHHARGASLAALKRFEEAVGALRRAVNLDPDYVDAIAYLGVALGELRRWQEAVGWHSRAMTLRPDANSGHNLGVALMELNRFEEAEKAFRHALRFEPSNVDLKSRLALAIGFQKRTDEAITLLEADLVTHPDDAALSCSLASVLVRAGRVEEALTLARHTARLHPSNSEAHVAVGWTCLASQQPHDALEAFTTASAIRAGLPEIDGGRACALSALGRHREAVDIFQQIVATDAEYMNRDEYAAEYFEESQNAVRSGRDHCDT